jgi:hypothetical protein
MTKYLFVMLGGALGAVSRFIVGTLVTRWYPGLFPLGTFLINTTGSFLAGVFMMLFLNRPAIDVNWRCSSSPEFSADTRRSPVLSGKRSLLYETEPELWAYLMQ